MKFLFASYHNYLEPSSGAAVSTRETLLRLANNGGDVRILCGSFFDDKQADSRTLFNILAERGIVPSCKRFTKEYEGRKVSFQIICFNDSGLEVVVFQPDNSFDDFYPHGFLPRSHGAIFLKLFLQLLQTETPDFYLTYGGYWTARFMVDAANERGVKTVFFLHNLSYKDPDFLKKFDGVVTPSEFARRYYLKNLRVDSKTIPPLVDESKVCVEQNSRRFLTLINSSPEKGVRLFLNILKVLNRTYPEIQGAIIIGRADPAELYSLLDKIKIKNLDIKEHVSDPRLIYRQTKLLVVPSLCQETFGRVVVEAGLNRIPVVCSNRGAAPELIPNKELVVDIPKCVYRKTELSEDELEPWIRPIVRLWFDEEYYRLVGERLFESTQRFASDRITEQILHFFENFEKK